MGRDDKKIKAWQLADQLALLVYKATDEELWAKAQEGVRTRQGLISSLEKSGV